MHVLLDKLVRLEPECFRKTALHYGVSIRGEWFELTYLTNAPAVVAQREALLQTAVQEAAEARNWAWDVECYMLGDGKRTYSGFVDSRPFQGGLEGSKTVDSDVGPAIALLLAYLAVLETQ